MLHFHVSAGGGGAHFNYFKYCWILGSTTQYLIVLTNLMFHLYSTTFICFTLISAYCADWIMLQKKRSAISVFTVQYM